MRPGFPPRRSRINKTSKSNESGQSMMPIRELLNRIRWDKEFAKAEFLIGYYDRLEDALFFVPLKRVVQEPGNHFSVKIMDDEGVVHLVPFHRIKAVYRNGELIWKREH
jgi:uncharacterized protein (UPF0248 family)